MPDQDKCSPPNGRMHWNKGKLMGRDLHQVQSTFGRSERDCC